MLESDLDRLVANERLGAGEQLEQDHTRGVNIGPLIGLTFGHQLG
jgi:hypothetical protein